MIIDSDMHPEKNIYYIGAVIIDIITRNAKNDLDINLLLHKYNANRTQPISMDYLLLGLDWLYILGTVSVDDSGVIKKCI